MTNFNKDIHLNGGANDYFMENTEDSGAGEKIKKISKHFKIKKKGGDRNKGVSTLNTARVKSKNGFLDNMFIIKSLKNKNSQNVI